MHVWTKHISPSGERAMQTLYRGPHRLVVPARGHTAGRRHIGELESEETLSLALCSGKPYQFHLRKLTVQLLLAVISIFLRIAPREIHTTPSALPVLQLIFCQKKKICLE